jgi:2-keto-4-pentenoate hydratase/2-oxohepta-3-ene-1,7-dioic acid hydratase in catechol pathway
MKLMRVGPPGHERPAVVLPDGTAVDASPVTADYDTVFFASGGLDDLARAVEDQRLEPLSANWIARRLGPPTARPPKIVCVGLNYADHARESGQTLPSEPSIFLKAPYTLVGPNDDVLIPRRSTKTDYEVELGVVIGRVARYLADPSLADEHIAGYCVSNDVSEREFQLERGASGTRASPARRSTPRAIAGHARGGRRPRRLQLTARVDGELRQDAAPRTWRSASITSSGT